MPNLTIRDIPSEILNKIRILSKVECRSMNSELLLILENGLKNYIAKNTVISSPIVTKEAQLEMWEGISGKWEDNRKTEDIMRDIYKERTQGRDVEL